jgi:hypothetical protein
LDEGLFIFNLVTRPTNTCTRHGVWYGTPPKDAVRHVELICCAARERIAQRQCPTRGVRRPLTYNPIQASYCGRESGESRTDKPTAAHIKGDVGASPVFEVWRWSIGDQHICDSGPMTLILPGMDEVVFVQPSARQIVRQPV